MCTRRILGVVVCLGLATAVCFQGEVSAAAGQWVKESGVRINVGPGPRSVFDPDVVQLSDGTFRMYYSHITVGIASATSSDGLAWTRDAGVRVGGGHGGEPEWYPFQPEVLRLSDGSYRMYYSCRSNEWVSREIRSATSSDGLLWTKEAGVRLAPGGPYDAWHVGDPQVVTLSDGSVRMYYTGSNRKDETGRNVLSAVSTDGLSFTKESGIRLAPGGNDTGGDARDISGFSILQNPDGTLQGFYGGISNSVIGTLMSATSTDGLSWTNDPGIAIGIGSPGDYDSVSVTSGEIVAMPEGVLRLYYSGYEGHFWRILSATFVPAIEVLIDVRPGEAENTINLSSSGVIPVAILSTPEFDATTQADPESLAIAGASVKMVGKSGKYLCHTEDVNGDGLDDLVCKFETAQFLIEPGVSVAVLEGRTYAGRVIRGEDSIRIVPDE
jgi:hypothetical protein